MWYKQQVSFYKTHADNVGTLATIEEILFWRFEPDLKTICQLRRLDKSAADYKQRKLELKNKLQCFTPAALLETKAKGQLKIKQRTNLMQFDFDYADIAEYDIDELKQAVFSLPFIGFCGLSCSGDGFYALALIDDPERLSEYAEHCFNVFEANGIKADTSKGKKVENLRYVSYDANMLVKEDPVPLKVKRFNTKPLVISAGYIAKEYDGDDTLLKYQLNELNQAQPGQRMNTIKKVAYTLGGKQNSRYLQELINSINGNGTFSDERKAFIRCAEDCFKAGMQRPF